MSATEFFMKQDVFIDYLNHEIRVTSIREDDMHSFMSTFLSSIVGDVVGLAPVYGSKCRLTHIAIASMTKVLFITLPSTAKGKARRKQKKGPSVSSLQAFLKNSAIVKCAFEMDVLASSLFFDFKYRICKGKDLLSLGTPTNSRDSLEARYAALSDGESKKFKKHAADALFLNKEGNHHKPEKVALQAWAACCAASQPKTAESLLKLPSIDTDEFDAPTLGMIAKNIRDMKMLISLKPNRMKHELELQTIKDGELCALSRRYKTKVSRLEGSRVVVVTARKGGEDSTRILHSVYVKGRSVKLPIGKGLRVNDIRCVETVGQEPLSALEESRSRIMLLMLQKNISHSGHPFVEKIWLPSNKPDWSAVPKVFFPPSIYFPSQRQLNASQTKAVRRILSEREADRLVLIHGPPGTGKTTVIAAAVTSTIMKSHETATLWLISQSNVAVKNIAEKLATVNFLDFKIIVSENYHFEWHQHQYVKIKENVITSKVLQEATTLAARLLNGSRVILCTLAMLSHPRLEEIVRCVPLQTVIFDEASQIEVGDYFPMLVTFRPTLRKLVFIGDDKQLAPYGTSDVPDLESIFEKRHLRTKAILLDTQYRMPIPVGDFISQHVYKGLLKSQHAQSDPSCCRFINVDRGVETAKGRSWTNAREVQVAIKIAHTLVELGKSFRIITPYDPQRALLEAGLKDAKLPWEDKCFNVDAFQGNEDDYIIISVVRTKKLGFLNDLRRLNVMLTRCKKGLVICTNRAFITGVASETLVGKLCQHLGNSSWLEERQFMRV